MLCAVKSSEKREKPSEGFGHGVRKLYLVPSRKGGGLTNERQEGSQGC